jgi:hypothetical protein
MHWLWMFLIYDNKFAPVSGESAKNDIASSPAYLSEPCTDPAAGRLKDCQSENTQLFLSLKISWIIAPRSITAGNSNKKERINATSAGRLSSQTNSHQISLNQIQSYDAVSGVICRECGQLRSLCILFACQPISLSIIENLHVSFLRKVETLIIQKIKYDSNSHMTEERFPSSSHSKIRNHLPRNCYFVCRQPVPFALSQMWRDRLLCTSRYEIETSNFVRQSSRQGDAPNHSSTFCNMELKIYSWYIEFH